MQKILPISMLALTAMTLLGGSVGMSALASTATHKGGGGNSIINITVNCNDNTQQHKKISSSNAVANVNVNCVGGGGGSVGPKGDKGDRGDRGFIGPIGATGLDGQNATVTIFTVPENTTNSTQSFTTSHFNCQTVGLMPFSCKSK